MLIELRLGPGKWKLRNAIREARVCAGFAPKRKVIPHMTLYGEFSADRSRVREIARYIAEVGSRFGPLYYRVDGFDFKLKTDGKYVLSLKIVPSENLKKFRSELAAKLQKIVPSPNDWDLPEGHSDSSAWFHVTIANNLPASVFKRAWPVLNGDNRQSFLAIFFNLFQKKQTAKPRKLFLNLPALRVTLLSDRGNIICEYDLMRKMLLSRSEALSRREWAKTLRKYRQLEGYEINGEKTRPGKQIFVISDTHFDHENIIKYCNRPFSNADEMNNVLVNNWNGAVKKMDKVFFLGDITFGRGAKPAEYWLKQLNGEIIFIRGNHDEVKQAKDYEVLSFGGKKFLLVHDPNKLPFKWDGWIIHGDKHNNDLKNYPFINGQKKTINVSCEVIGYCPLSLADLLALDIDSIARKEAIGN